MGIYVCNNLSKRAMFCQNKYVQGESHSHRTKYFPRQGESHSHRTKYFPRQGESHSNRTEHFPKLAWEPSFAWSFHYNRISQPSQPRILKPG